MSIPVKVEDLAKALDDFDTAYLLSVGAAGVKVVCVEVTVDEDGVHIPTQSKGTAGNIAQNPAVTLLCPPREPRGFTLLADGTARVDGEGFLMTPRTAVLHRPASHADAPVDAEGCGQDCAPVE
ncbi:pyridoxamine 5'-phosphate oxidase [Cumulibacter soli]|uniref:pyridoxamine 5'-phosphate oxidase n=1 Tax=Cumulibacter soli TaxID=2546344 RepID=UPI00106841D1|nr:pyridoxamine 5'-phosphate oxidase [Cumulibacter soli]